MAGGSQRQGHPGARSLKTLCTEAIYAVAALHQALVAEQLSG